MYCQHSMIWNSHGIGGAAGFMLLRWDFAQRLHSLENTEQNLSSIALCQIFSGMMGMQVVSCTYSSLEALAGTPNSQHCTRKGCVFPTQQWTVCTTCCRKCTEKPSEGLSRYSGWRIRLKHDSSQGIQRRPLAKGANMGYHKAGLGVLNSMLGPIFSPDA